MKLNQTLTLVAGFTAALQLATAGNITGKVTLKGTPPAEKEITGITDAACSATHTTPMKTRFFVVGAGGELADAVVMLKGVPNAKSTGASAAPVVIDQKGCEYFPYVGAAQTGQQIVVKNSDQTMHNVHPSPANTAGGNKEDNKAQFAGGADISFTFPATENFLKFACNVHPWMFSYITIVDHPYFTVTGKDGTFTIKDVPAGKYKIVALHRKAALAGVEQDVEVTADGAKTDFTLEVK
jgi:plastocyanin